MSSLAARESALAALRHVVRPASTVGEAARETARPLPTGIEALDALLDGGLPRGRMSALAGPRSSGRTSLTHAMLAAATARGEATALVDVGRALDARRAEAAGIDLARLLWVPTGDARRGLQAADLVLDAGGFGLVVLDFGEGAPRASDAGWLRLGRGAERSGAALLVVSARPASVGTFAALSLATAVGGAPRFVGAVRPVLVSLASRVDLVRSRRAAPGGRAAITLSLR